MKQGLTCLLLMLLALLTPGCGSGADPSVEAARTSPPPDLRIAVVGAGASGLVAAHTLRKLGYSKVTVFEREQRVGGKVRTHPEGELRGVELGAYYLALRNSDGVVLSLADELGVRYVADEQPKFIVGEDGVPRRPLEHLRHLYSEEEITAVTDRYAHVVERFSAVRHRFTDLHPDLALDFDAFAEKHGITPIAHLARAPMLAFGYAYFDELPAAYVMRILHTVVPLGPDGLEEPRYLVFPRPEGFHALWEALAATLDVRLGTEVTKISRTKGPGTPSVTLTMDGAEELRFDRVILTPPLADLPQFLDSTDEERHLFGQVRSNHFFVSFFAAAGLPSPHAWFFDRNATRDRINHVGGWGDTGIRVEVSKNWNAPVFVAYQTAAWDATAEDVNAALRSDVKDAGGVLAKVLLQAEWSYMPFVSGEHLAEGFFDRIEVLQGQHGSYFVGSTLGFETVEQSARYARDLVTAHFPDRRP